MHTYKIKFILINAFMPKQTIMFHLKINIYFGGGR